MRHTHYGQEEPRASVASHLRTLTASGETEDRGASSPAASREQGGSPQAARERGQSAQDADGTVRAPGRADAEPPRDSPSMQIGGSSVRAGPASSLGCGPKARRDGRAYRTEEGMSKQTGGRKKRMKEGMKERMEVLLQDGGLDDQGDRPLLSLGLNRKCNVLS